MRLGNTQVRTPKGFSDYRLSFQAGVTAGYWQEPAMFGFVNPTRYIAYIAGYIKGTELREHFNQTADEKLREFHKELMARNQAAAARMLQ